MANEAPSELLIKQSLRDIRKAQIVEFIVDEQGKCWLNVDEECVARIGFSDSVSIEVYGEKVRRR